MHIPLYMVVFLKGDELVETRLVPFELSHDQFVAVVLPSFSRCSAFRFLEFLNFVLLAHLPHQGRTCVVLKLRFRLKKAVRLSRKGISPSCDCLCTMRLTCAPKCLDAGLLSS